MAFGYLISVLLFGVLYGIGMKTMSFIDQTPQTLPQEKDYTITSKCNIFIGEKSFNCIKEEHIIKTYHYSVDCDIIERIIKHNKYTLNNMIRPEDLKKCMKDKKSLLFEVEENGNLIKCYACDDLKRLISYASETQESVYSYRKPFKKKISA